MDFITHSLIGVGAARLLVGRRDLRPQVTLAALLGALVIDGDSWLYLIDPSYYGRYHRVASHSILGVMAVGLFCAAVPWVLARAWPKARRFGWFANENLRREEAVPPLAPFWMFAAAAWLAACLHVPMDAITGFGNVQPFWPWSTWDASMHAVTSFDTVIYGLTFAWHIVLRRLKWPRRKEAIATGIYAAMVIGYILFRWLVTEPTFW